MVCSLHNTKLPGISWGQNFWRNTEKYNKKRYFKASVHNKETQSLIKLGYCNKFSSITYRLYGGKRECSLLTGKWSKILKTKQQNISFIHMLRTHIKDLEDVCSILECKKKEIEKQALQNREFGKLGKLYSNVNEIWWRTRAKLKESE